MKYSILAVFTLSLFVSNAVMAAPSKGKMLTQCKQQIAESLGDGSRMKIKRIRNRTITLLVRRPGEEKSQPIVCRFTNKTIQLATPDGTALTGNLASEGSS